MIGDKLSFCDVAILCFLRGYKGSATEHYESNTTIPLLKAFDLRIREEPKIKAFLASDRTVDIYHDSFI